MDQRKGDGIIEKKDGSSPNCLMQILFFLCFLVFLAVSVKSCAEMGSDYDEDTELYRGYERQ